MVLIIPVTPPEEEVIYTANNMKLKIGSVMVGNGTIYICQNSLCWQPDNRPEGIVIYWKQISVHGISTNPTKCIYFMLDHKVIWRGVYDGSQQRVEAVLPNGNEGVLAGLPMEGINNGHIDGGGGGDNGVELEIDEGNETDEDVSEAEEEQMTECWFLPDDVNAVDTIFQAMTECQALHPDSADSSLSDESDGFMDDDGRGEGGVVGGLGPNGQQPHAEADAAEAAQGGIRDLNINNDRFADADE